MKRIHSLLLVLTLLAALMAGCGGAQTATEETESKETSSVETVAVEEDTVVVKTIDELLAAIAPETTIVIEPGTYLLSEASNYGEKSVSPYYTWEDANDGYQLKLRGVNGLTIRGSGMDTTVISAEPRYADVLVFQNCSQIFLENFTAGHTVETTECAGGVLSLWGCSDVTVRGLGLYGCGVVGVQADLCTRLAVEDCDIYECSSTGIALNRTDLVTIDNCKLYDLGQTEYGGSAVFHINSSNDIVITNCEVRDNSVQSLLYAAPCDTVQVRNCTFLNNRVYNSAFSIWKAGLVLDNNTFQNNNVRIWNDVWDEEAEAYIVDGQGNPLTEEQLDAMNKKEETAEPAADQTEVIVSTVDGFLSAIAPNTRIVLDAPLFDLSTAAGYGVSDTEYYYWSQEHDGPSLVITGVDNMTICSSDDDVEAVTISALPRYANVLTFKGCSDVTVQGFTAGHTQEPGYCAGGVLAFRDCDRILVDKCGLYGCGTLGVFGEYSGDLKVTNCEIYECSNGGIQMWGVDGIIVENCTYRELGGPIYRFNDCINAVIDGENVDGSNYSSGPFIS